MRVAITVPWGARYGGAETMLWNFLVRVDRERFQPTVVFFQDGPFAAEVEALDIPTAVVTTRRLRHLTGWANSVRELAHVLRGCRPGLVVNWTPKTQLYGAPAASLVGLRDRVVWWQHGVSTGHWMDRLATSLPSRAVGCSSLAAQEAQASLRPGRRTFVVHPGVEPPPVADAGERRATRARLGIPSDRTVVGIVGRLQRDKGIDRFLAALAKLHRGGHPVHGLIVGGEAPGLSDGYEAELGAHVRRLKLTDRVTMTGQVPVAIPYVRAMDILASASDRESFGIALVEAMMLGVPVVAASRGGPLEIVRPGHSGVLTTPEDPDAFASALELLVADPNLRDRLGDEARRDTRARFSAESMTARLEAELAKVANA